MINVIKFSKHTLFVFVFVSLFSCSGSEDKPSQPNNLNINTSNLSLLFPGDGSKDIDVNISAIRINYSGLNGALVDSSNISLSPYVAGSVIQVNDTELQFIPSSILSEYTTYTIQVNGLKDLLGDSIAMKTWIFTTGSSLVVNLNCSTISVLCVDATGNQEYNTIQEAVDVSQAGDTVLVFDGDYAGFRVNKSGTSSERIKILTRTSNVNIVSSEPYGNNAIRIDNASYITIEGFNINRSGTTLSSNYDNACIAARGANFNFPMQSLHFTNNKLNSCNPAGMYLSNVNNLFLKRNSIENTNQASAGSQGMGLYIANSGSKNAMILENRINNNYGHGIHFNGDSSVGGDGIQQGHIIERNSIIGNGINGFNMDGVQNTTITNNIFSNNGRHAIRGFQIDGGKGPTGFSINNNTFYNNSSSPVKMSSDSGGHNIFNNLVISNGDNYFVIDNVNFINSNNYIGTNGSTIFQDISSHDYRLKGGTVAINSGITQFSGVDAPLNDISSQIRSEKPDLGAFELGSELPAWY